MKQTVISVVAAVMILLGAVWTLQGLGYVKGSPMTGVELWAIVGPILAGFGVALLLAAFRRPS